MSLCLLAVNFVVYGPSLAFGFLVDSDDQAYIFRNPYLQDLTRQNLWAILSNLHYDTYNPLTLISYSLDYSFWKFDPYGYHLTQLLLHTLNACLAFVLLLNISIPPVAAVGIAMVYAVHPIHVESVVWVSERKNLLSTFFIFSALIFYVRNAVLANPEYAKALNNLGAILIDRKEYASAKDFIGRAQQADPSLSSVYKNLAVIADRTGKDVAKVSAWKKKIDELEVSKAVPEKDCRLGAFRFQRAGCG